MKGKKGKRKQKKTEYYIDKKNVLLWVWLLLGAITIMFQSIFLFPWVIISLFLMFFYSIIKSKK